MDQKTVAELYPWFCEIKIAQLQDCLLSAKSREEKAFFREMLNLKLQLAQEQVVGEVLL